MPALFNKILLENCLQPSRIGTLVTTNRTLYIPRRGCPTRSEYGNGTSTRLQGVAPYQTVTYDSAWFPRAVAISLISSYARTTFMDKAGEKGVAGVHCCFPASLFQCPRLPVPFDLALMKTNRKSTDPPLFFFSTATCNCSASSHHPPSEKVLVVAASAYRIVCTDVYHRKTLRFDLFIFFFTFKRLRCALVSKGSADSVCLSRTRRCPTLISPRAPLFTLPKYQWPPLLESAVALSQPPIHLGFLLSCIDSQQLLVPLHLVHLSIHDTSASLSSPS